MAGQYCYLVIVSLKREIGKNEKAGHAKHKELSSYSTVDLLKMEVSGTCVIALQHQ